MIRRPVVSSNIASIGFDPETSTLELFFKPDRRGNSAIWRYSPVESAIFQEMCDPQNSVGKVFHSRVRSNPRITSTRVDDTKREAA